MIPTLLIVGLLTRRVWVVPVGALVWGALLLILGSVGLSDLPLSAGLAAANLAIGVLVHRLIAEVWRKVRSRPAQA